MNEFSDRMTIKRALISSWRKEQAVDLAGRLDKLGVKISASGGTADAISGSGIAVERLSEKTGFSELLGGRVKTLHPAIYAGILVQRSLEDDLADLEKFKIQPFDLIAVDLYPFPKSSDGLIPIEKAVELIDIGGVSLIRAAAKNFRWVSVIPSADLFGEVISVLEASGGSIEGKYRRELAAKAFKFIAEYDSRIANRLAVSDISVE